MKIVPLSVGEPLAGKIDQMLVVYDEYLREHREALDRTDPKDDTFENLRQLGYID